MAAWHAPRCWAKPVPSGLRRHQKTASAPAWLLLILHNSEFIILFVPADVLPFDWCGRGAAPALGNYHSCQNEGEAQELFSAKTFTGNDDGSQQGENGLQRKNQGRVGWRSVLLRPDLGAEGKSGGKDSRHDNSEDQTAGPMQRRGGGKRRCQDGDGPDHQDLARRKLRERNAPRPGAEQHDVNSE